MKNFNKIMGSLNNTVRKLEALSTRKIAEKKLKQEQIKKINQDVEAISAEEVAAVEVAKKLRALFTPTPAKKIQGA